MAVMVQVDDNIDNTRTHGLEVPINTFTHPSYGVPSTRDFCFYEMKDCLRFSFIYFQLYFTQFIVLSFVLNKNTACWWRQNVIAIGEQWIPADAYQRIVQQHHQLSTI